MALAGRHIACGLGLFLAASLATVWASSSAEQSGSIESWLRRCEQAQDLDLAVDRLLFGAVILNAAVKNGAQVQVEISRRPGRGFKRVGEIGLSVLGEYPNWLAEPPDVQAAFSRLVACVEQDPSLQIPAGELVTSADAITRQRKPTPPWLLLAGILAGVVVVAIRLQERWSSRVVTHGFGLLLLAAITFVARPYIAPFGFVHQNGQGPLWVSYALGRVSAYGPGYREIFGWLTRLEYDPNAVIFVTQALLGAFGPVFVWALARASNAGSVGAWVVALLFAADPSLARLSQSESYFAICAHLLLAAAALLALGTNQRGPRDRVFRFAIIAAGLLISQAARVHPVSWVAAATVPMVVLVGRGDLRGRLAATVAAAVGIGLVVAAAAGSTMLQVLNAGLGRHWAPALSFSAAFDRMTETPRWTILAAVAVILLSRERLRGAFAAGAFLVTVVVLQAAFVMGREEPIVVDGYVSLFLAPLIATALAGLGGVTRRGWHGSVLALAAMGVWLAGASTRAAEVRALPTDTMELALVIEWSESLADESVVAYLGEADRRTLFLPLYGEFGRRSPTARRLKKDEPVPELHQPGRPTLYYRSSLCSSEDGRAFCQRVESGVVLTPLHTVNLPARPSRHYLPYDRDEVDVGLYRVEGRR